MIKYNKKSILTGTIQIWDVHLDDLWDYSIFIMSNIINKSDYLFQMNGFKTRQAAITAALRHIKKEFKDYNVEIEIRYKEYLGKDYE